MLVKAKNFDACKYPPYMHEALKNLVSERVHFSYMKIMLFLAQGFFQYIRRMDRNDYLLPRF